MTWHLPQLVQFMPEWLASFLYPVDKTDLDLLRLVHFLALAVLTIRFVPRDWRMLKSWALRPVIQMGQHSLEIFCLGVFLAFAGHFATVDISAGVGMQVLVSALGILAMIALAMLISWYNSIGVPFEIVTETPEVVGEKGESLQRTRAANEFPSSQQPQGRA